MRSRARIEAADGALFCSEICQDEYAELEPKGGSASGSSPNS
ncbi:MAG: hypothetical protein OXG37_11595 [Actinomycetia bacterium]|nr:hypothetical protein [Actinomycetes bacterium]